MKTFIFNDPNGSASLCISSVNIEDAYEYMRDLGLNPDLWRCEDEEGEDEEA